MQRLRVVEGGEQLCVGSGAMPPICGANDLCSGLRELRPPPISNVLLEFTDYYTHACWAGIHRASPEGSSHVTSGREAMIIGLTTTVRRLSGRLVRLTPARLLCSRPATEPCSHCASASRQATSALWSMPVKPSHPRLRLRLGSRWLPTRAMTGSSSSGWRSRRLARRIGSRVWPSTTRRIGRVGSAIR